MLCLGAEGSIGGGALWRLGHSRACGRNWGSCVGQALAGGVKLPTGWNATFTKSVAEEPWRGCGELGVGECWTKSTIILWYTHCT
jgi:hypothetical protein